MTPTDGRLEALAGLKRGRNLSTLAIDMQIGHWTHDWVPKRSLPLSIGRCGGLGCSASDEAVERPADEVGKDTATHAEGQVLEGGQDRVLSGVHRFDCTNSD